MPNALPAVCKASPQVMSGLASRSAGRAGVAAGTGAALLVLADLIGANLPNGLQLPVGVTAGLLGGGYLLLLLNGQERKR